MWPTVGRDAHVASPATARMSSGPRTSSAQAVSLAVLDSAWSLGPLPKEADEAPAATGARRWAVADWQVLVQRRTPREQDDATGKAGRTPHMEAGLRRRREGIERKMASTSRVDVEHEADSWSMATLIFALRTFFVVL